MRWLPRSNDVTGWPSTARIGLAGDGASQLHASSANGSERDRVEDQRGTQPVCGHRALGRHVLRRGGRDSRVIGVVDLVAADVNEPDLPIEGGEAAHERETELPRDAARV